MSYILDALTKLDQERQRARPPDLYAPPAATSPRQSRWPYVLGGAASAVALTVLWFQFWGSARVNPSAPRSATPSVPAKPVGAPVSLPESAQRGLPPAVDVKPPANAASAPKAVAPLPADKVLRPDASARPEAAMRADVSMPTDAATPPRPGSAPAPRAAKAASGAESDARDLPRARASTAPAKAEPKEAPRTPTRNGARKAAGEATVPAPGAREGVASLAELPSTIQQEMPKIALSGHAYSSDSKARVAIVNGRLLSEGDELSAGVKVEQILRDGVVFSYKGHRFRP